MKITPLEINKQEFKKTMRGYDPVEVDTFLEMLGSEYEKLINSNKTYEKKIIELETELKNYKEVERTLKQTLMNVQETSDKSKENLKKEADLIRKEAELSAAKLMEKARRETQLLKEEMVTLKTQKQSLISRLRHVLTSQLELLDVLELDDLDIAKLKDRTKKVFSNAQIQQSGGSKTEKSGDIAEADSEIVTKSKGNDVKSKTDILNDFLDTDLEIGKSKT